jgi:hypothetical protein
MADNFNYIDREVLALSEVKCVLILESGRKAFILFDDMDMDAVGLKMRRIIAKHYPPLTMDWKVRAEWRELVYGLPYA